MTTNTAAAAKKPTTLALLADQVVDVQAELNGAWMHLGPDYGDTEVKVSGLNADYDDEVQRRIRKAGGRRPDQLPGSKRQEIVRETFAEMCFHGVRNLEHHEGERKGQPVTADEFRALILEPRYRKVYLATLSCAADVGEAWKEQAKAAAGKSPSASPTISDGHTSSN